MSSPRFLLYVLICLIAVKEFVSTAVASNPVLTARIEREGTATSHILDLLDKNAAQKLKLFEYFQSGNCSHVYFDLGTNHGVQIRKLYQPDRFPGSASIPIFNEYFGVNASMRRRVCTVGFEPNHRLSEKLLAMQEKYQAQNIPVVIFTSAAVSTKDDIVKFSIPCKDHLGLGGSIIANYSCPNETTRGDAFAIAMDFASLLDSLVKIQSEKLPVLNGSFGNWIAKMDIEGTEYSVLPHLLSEGHSRSYCRLARIMIEWHPRKPIAYGRSGKWYDSLPKPSDCNCTVVPMDDKKYADSSEADDIPIGLEVSQRPIVPLSGSGSGSGSGSQSKSESMKPVRPMVRNTADRKRRIGYKRFTDHSAPKGFDTAMHGEPSSTPKPAGESANDTECRKQKWKILFAR